MDDMEQAGPRTERFRFHGKAGEYFGIIFVNHILMWATLGIYAPWAKVRALQYLYGNTELAGGSFQFTASPLKMLVSRLIALALLLVYLALDFIGTSEALMAYAGFIVAWLVFAPILTVFVVSFRLRYSAWRGIPFSFKKNYRGAYRVYLAPMLTLGLVIGCLALPQFSLELEQALGIERHLAHGVDPAQVDTMEKAEETLDVAPLEPDGEEEAEGSGYTNPWFYLPSGFFLLIFIGLLPYFDFINVRYLASHARFGTADFAYLATPRDFYVVYGWWMAATALLGLGWYLFVLLESKVFFGWLVFLTVLWFPMTHAYMKSRRYNLLVDKIAIAGDGFRLRAAVPFWGMFFLMVTNSIMVTITLGLMRAWAQIRTVNFMLQHTQLQARESLDSFAARQEEQQSAIGEEVADTFDLDVAF